MVMLALVRQGAARAAPGQQTQPTCAWVNAAAGERRAQHAMADLPVRQGMIVFGGADIRGMQSSVKDDLHVLDLSSGPPGRWSELRTSGGPNERSEHTATLRQTTDGTQELIVYGGFNAVPTGGTFTWQSPLFREGPALDGPRRTDGLDQVESNAFRLAVTATDATWRRVSAQGQNRTDHSAIYFPDEDALIVFGGRSDIPESSAVNDLTRLSLGPSEGWASIEVGGGPSARYAHSAIYDAAGKRMIVFGGTDDWMSGTNDVWELALAQGTGQAAWRQLQPTGAAPRGRYNHAAAYDPNLRWMVVFGGTRDGRTEFNDVAALDLSADPPAWRTLQVSGTARVELTGTTAAYSAAAGAIVFYGGTRGGNSQTTAFALRCAVPTPPASPTPSITATTEATATPAATTPAPATATDTPRPTDTEAPTATLTPTSAPTSTWTPEPTPTKPHVFLPYGAQRHP